MSQTVVGLYDDHSTAEKVVDKLDNQGFTRSNIHVESHSGKGTGSFGNDLVGGLSQRGVPDDEARFYAEGVRRGGTLVVLDVDDDRARDVAAVMNEHRPVRMKERRAAWREEGYEGYDESADRYSEEEVTRERERYATSGDEESVPVVEEEVRIGKRTVERGGIRIHSRVVEERVEEDVTVRDEEIDVQERNVDRELSPEEADAAFREQDIEMTETDEEVVVDKKARQTGEVTARKTAQDRTEHVSETARRTEVDVEEIGRGDYRRGEAVEFSDYDEDYRRHYKDTYGDGDYATYEPAYRHGHAFGSDERYAGREYREVEPELRSSYEKRHGKGTWEKVKDAVKHGFTSSSGRGHSTRRRT